MTLCLGIDIGTNGARIIAVDAAGAPPSRARSSPWRRRGARAIAPSRTRPSGGRRCWRPSPRSPARSISPRVRRIAVDGTSGTFLLIDDAGRPQGPGIMYNDARGGAAAKRIAAVAPGESGAHGATSALARLMTLRDAEPGSPGVAGDASGGLDRRAPGGQVRRQRREQCVEDGL